MVISPYRCHSTCDINVKCVCQLRTHFQGGVIKGLDYFMKCVTSVWKSRVETGAFLNNAFDLAITIGAGNVAATISITARIAVASLAMLQHCSRCRHLHGSCQGFTSGYSCKTGDNSDFEVITLLQSGEMVSSDLSARVSGDSDLVVPNQPPRCTSGASDICGETHTPAFSPALGDPYQFALG